MCVCTDQAGRGAQQPWAVLGRAWGAQEPCPETFTGSAATTVVLPLAAPLARNVLELHLAVGHWLGLGFGLGLGFVCSRCSMRCHAAGTKGRHTAYFPPSPQATPHGSRLASAWMRACSPSPQTVSHRRMPSRTSVGVPRLGRTRRFEGGYSQPRAYRISVGYRAREVHPEILWSQFLETVCLQDLVTAGRGFESEDLGRTGGG